MAHIAMKNYGGRKIWIVKNGQMVQNPLMKFTFMSNRYGDQYKSENRYLFSSFSNYGHAISYFTYNVTQNSDSVRLYLYVKPYDGGYKNRAVSFELGFPDGKERKYYFKGNVNFWWGAGNGTSYLTAYSYGSRSAFAAGSYYYSHSGNGKCTDSSGVKTIDRKHVSNRYLYSYAWGQTYESDPADIRMETTVNIIDFYYIDK